MKSKKFIGPKLIDDLALRPELAMEKIDLVYVNDRHLSIARKKERNTFKYIYKGKVLTEPSQLKRIEKLVLPPAWANVRITHLINGHLQATGKDAKSRKQYRYHPTWSKVRNQTKFYRMANFGKNLPALRSNLDKDLVQKGWPKSKMLALVVRLMEESHIRIGNDQYVKKNKTYGLTTLRKKHVDIYKDQIKFHFTGKRGKKHKVSVRSKRLAVLVSRCEEIPGWELFKYYDEDGKHRIDSEMVNNYLQENCGISFTAKDFRTWAASVIFFETLKDLALECGEGNRQKNILKSLDQASRALGNTRNVCRKYYVHPHIISTYEKDRIKTFFDKANSYKDLEYFTASEQALLELIQEYKPSISGV